MIDVYFGRTRKWKLPQKSSICYSCWLSTSIEHFPANNYYRMCGAKIILVVTGQSMILSRGSGRSWTASILIPFGVMDTGSETVRRNHEITISAQYCFYNFITRYFSCNRLCPLFVDFKFTYPGGTAAARTKRNAISRYIEGRIWGYTRRGRVP